MAAPSAAAWWPLFHSCQLLGNHVVRLALYRPHPFLDNISYYDIYFVLQLTRQKLSYVRRPDKRIWRLNHVDHLDRYVVCFYAIFCAGFVDPFKRQDRLLGTLLDCARAHRQLGLATMLVFTQMSRSPVIAHRGNEEPGVRSVGSGRVALYVFTILSLPCCYSCTGTCTT